MDFELTENNEGITDLSISLWTARMAKALAWRSSQTCHKNGAVVWLYWSRHQRRISERKSLVDNPDPLSSIQRKQKITEPWSVAKWRTVSSLSTPAKYHRWERFLRRWNREKVYMAGWPDVVANEPPVSDSADAVAVHLYYFPYRLAAEGNQTPRSRSGGEKRSYLEGMPTMWLIKTVDCETAAKTKCKNN